MRNDNTNNNTNNTLEHKNLELFRFYVTNNIKSIEEKIDNNSNIQDYLLGAAIDYIIPSVFDFSNLDAILKVFIVIALIVIFIMVPKIISKIRACYRASIEGSGLNADKPSEQIQTINEFDNIACAGLLICQHYINKYNIENCQHIKMFYLYEVLHYLKKINNVYLKIVVNPKLYVNCKDSEMIDKWRIGNFLDFLTQINMFIQNEFEGVVKDKELEDELIDIDNYITKWSKDREWLNSIK